ncbi:MAG: PilZ domain-containing protein [Proteobacteria bacterium]|nr:PilZ domain-containing protein [Pseudomonadota bacterium]
MAWNNRRADRVIFASGYAVKMMAIDGMWQRPCTLLDISNSGVRLLMQGSLEGLDLKEFFLLLSSTGLAFRRCELIRVTGDEIGARFIDDKDPGKKKNRSLVRSD